MPFRHSAPIHSSNPVVPPYARTMASKLISKEVMAIAAGGAGLFGVAAMLLSGQSTAQAEEKKGGKLVRRKSWEVKFDGPEKYEKPEGLKADADLLQEMNKHTSGKSQVGN